MLALEEIFKCRDLCDVEIKSLLCIVLNSEIDVLDSALVYVS